MEFALDERVVKSALAQHKKVMRDIPMGLEGSVVSIEENNTYTVRFDGQSARLVHGAYLARPE